MFNFLFFFYRVSRYASNGKEKLQTISRSTRSEDFSLRGGKIIIGNNPTFWFWFQVLDSSSQGESDCSKSDDVRIRYDRKKIEDWSGLISQYQWSFHTHRSGKARIWQLSVQHLKIKTRFSVFLFFQLARSLYNSLNVNPVYNRFLLRTEDLYKMSRLNNRSPKYDDHNYFESWNKNSKRNK